MTDLSDVRIIGITGGIGSGKSTVGKIIADRGMVVIDSDEIARELVEPGSEALEEIIWEFGQDILSVDGRLDRIKMASLVFTDENKRTRLEKILHPRICNEYRKRACDSASELVFILMPLLFEADLVDDVDSIWLCYAPVALRLERTIKRDDSNGDEVLARINAQISDEEKIDRSDVILYTDCTLPELEKRVEAALADLAKKK